MVIVKYLARLLTLACICATLAGCANLFPTKSASAASAPTPPAGPLPQESREVAQGPMPKPRPAPALYIGGQPEPIVEGPKKADVLPVVQVQFQELPAKEQPDNSTSLRELYRRAVQRYATLDTYAMRLKRREVIGSKDRPEEIMMCRFRKEPFSVYFKWVGKEGNGREVIYVKNQHDNMIHTLLAAGDHPFRAAGSRYKVAPDSFLLRAKLRYPITDAGLGPLIDNFGKLVQALEKGDSRFGTAQYIGPVKRPEFEKDVIEVRQTLQPQTDPNLPRGGQRLWFFDPANQLPTLIIATDETGREMEYYCHDHFWLNHPMSDEDFNPERMWPGAK